VLFLLPKTGFLARFCNARKRPVAPDKTTLGVLYAFSFLRNLPLFRCGSGAVLPASRRARLYAHVHTGGDFLGESLRLRDSDGASSPTASGRKKSLALGSLLFGLGFLAFGFSVDYAILLAAEVVAALGMSMMSGADRALLYETIRAAGRNDDATAIMARHDAFGTVGLFVSLIAGPLFVSSGLVPYRDALGQTFLATAAVSSQERSSISSLARATDAARRKRAPGRRGWVPYIFESRPNPI
jgi:MFS family permease